MSGLHRLSRDAFREPSVLSLRWCASNFGLVAYRLGTSRDSIIPLREAAGSHSAARPGASPGCRIRQYRSVPPTPLPQHEIPVAARASSPAGAARSTAAALQVGEAPAYPPIDGDEAEDPKHYEERRAARGLASSCPSNGNTRIRPSPSLP
jgi:hypothetical protein